MRHGESEGNLDPGLYTRVPDHAIELSERGHRQAQAAGEALASLIELPSDTPLRVWTSPYRRTRQTADHLQGALQRRFVELDRREHINLCEQQFGLFDGVPDEELPIRFPQEHAHYDLAERFEGKFWARMPLGESRFDVAVRAHQAFGTFHRDAERYGLEHIVVVCHGVTLRAFVMQWLHLPYEWFERQPNPGNCDIVRIAEEPGARGMVARYVYRSASGIELGAPLE